jgi:hypothetical protein
MRKSFFIFSLIFSTSVFSQINDERKLLDKFFPTSDQCGLKRFSLATYDHEISELNGHPGISRQRLMAAIWETTDPSCMKNYGVVQYIKGCIYSIIHDPKSGTNDPYFGVTRISHGQSIDFQHKDWEIDSVDTDPLYSSYEGKNVNAENRLNWQQFPFLL